jgi:ferritin
VVDTAALREYVGCRQREDTMLSSRIVDLLNRQINLEFYSSNLYLQMAAWCAYRGFEGSAAFLRGHAGEERMHMQKLFDYVEECGALPLLGTIDAPAVEYEGISAVFERTLEHEIAITARINELVAAALEEKDFSSFHFLQWYVAEQHEEEKLFRSILDKLRIIGAEGRGAYLFDKELRKLAAAAGA